MNSKPFLLAATLSAATLAPRAQAQSAPAYPNVAAPNAASYQSPQWQAFRVRNVPSSLMAWWLDPEHTALLAQREAKPTWATGRTPAEIGEMLSRPAGVSAVVSIDAQNSIWVLGSAAGIERVKEKLALLDTPLRQVEVEAQIIAISDADAKTLGIAFTKGEGAVEVGIAGAGIQGQIAALIAQERAKIITAPRVTALLGSTATLQSVSSTPMLFSIKDEGAKGFEVRQFARGDRPEDQSVLLVSTSISLSVTPSRNADGSFSLQLGPLRTLGLSGLHPGSFKSGMDIVLKDRDGIPNRPITLNDRQTAVLRGMKWGQGKNSNVIALITPRLVRRADDPVETIALQR